MTAEGPSTTTADARVTELLQRLLRIDSSNPPGRERECIELLAGELRMAGLEPRVLARDVNRPNLVARVAGRGEAPPLLLYGHVDVVPAGSEDWRHDPFGASLVDGELWGRGALDMKGGLAMLATVLLQAAQPGAQPPGDLIFVANSDEEAGGDYGAAWLVDEHPELFEGVRHALSEFGGYSHHVAGRRLYPVQVAQKRRCTLRATIRGEGGHGASPRRGQVAGKLGAALAAIDRRRLPTHLTAPVRLMIEAMAGGLPAPLQAALRLLLVPAATGPVLRIAGAQAEDLDPLLRNTATATIVRAGEAWNVLPTEAQVDLDGRLVPGHEPAELLEELAAILPDDTTLEILQADPPATRLEPDLELLPLLTSVLHEEDPQGHAFPLVTAGMTDARHYDRLGIQTYGFLPMRLPHGLMPQLLHATDERIPVAALGPGVAAIRRVVDRYRPR
ncbi:MAG: M20/M25/M40 family metallo-hydrolase [Actinomycetota bacterium]|nr:M20/M25/M40 family metallo-hydrolase [Actinomycetota bacterium]